MLTGVMYKHSKCNEDIYFDDKYKTKSGINIPMDPNTGKYHKCKTTVHKRKGMLRVLTKTQVTYYKVLGIYPGASVTEIEEAYKHGIERWHPDKNKDMVAPVMYKKVIEAHNNIRLIRVVDE